MTNFKYIQVLALLVSAFTYADDTAVAKDKEKYCDFNLYLPAKSEGTRATLLLERSDLSSLNTTTDNNTVQWTIEVADHVLSKWKTASKEHIGLPTRALVAYVSSSRQLCRNLGLSFCKGVDNCIGAGY